MKIGVIGGGVWGSALAHLLSKNKVIIFARDNKIVKSINDYHFNPKLKYTVFNDNVSANINLELISDMDYIFVALPSQAIRNVFSKLDFNKKDQEIVIASKGIEIKSSLLLSDVIKEFNLNKKISVLSGPCFSDEISQNLPTAITLATENKESFKLIKSLISNKNFRMYYSDDLIGCQIGGALKNIYAIAAGITIGLNLGENAKSAIITRSFIEIARFSKLFGAKNKTIFGLSGLGDLILTCNSIKSRNTKFGKDIATINNFNIDDVLQSGEVIEGYFSTEAVNKIANEKKIDMPIMKSVYNILYNNASIKKEIKKLLERPMIDEF
jgi:glycerol-3-phosphate dehydrogenase (NAD(P)+)